MYFTPISVASNVVFPTCGNYVSLECSMKPEVPLLEIKLRVFTVLGEMTHQAQLTRTGQNNMHVMPQLAITGHPFPVPIQLKQAVSLKGSDLNLN